jgi:hypothetical protein
MEAKRADAFRRSLASDPELRAKHSSASAERLRAWRATEAGAAFTNANSLANLAVANTTENLARRKHAIRAKRLAWCPETRWDEYTKLARRMPAAEARRIIEADLAALERRRLAAMTKYQRAMERIAGGAQLVDAWKPNVVGPAFTLGGVASSEL